MLDLVGQNVQVTMWGDAEPTVLSSPFQADHAPALLPELTAMLSVHDTASVHGRISIREASPEVLRTIPGIQENILEQILAQRNSPAAAEDQFWPLNQGLVTIDEMRKIAPYINHRGNTCRAQVVGYFADGSASCRLEVVIDASGGSSRLLMCRDLSHLGRGFSLETLRGVASEIPS